MCSPAAFSPTVVGVLVLAAEPELDRHDTGTEHPEQPARLRAALSGLDAAGLRDAVVKTEPRRASEEELALVHPRSYFESLAGVLRGGAAGPSTPTRSLCPAPGTPHFWPSEAASPPSTP